MLDLDWRRCQLNTYMGEGSVPGHRGQRARALRTGRQAGAGAGVGTDADEGGERTLSTKGASRKSGPPMERLMTFSLRSST